MAQGLVQLPRMCSVLLIWPLLNYCSRLFAKEGYTVALVSRGSESLNALASSINASGGNVLDLF
jgi:hypothetical protein